MKTVSKKIIAAFFLVMTAMSLNAQTITANFNTPLCGMVTANLSTTSTDTPFVWTIAWGDTSTPDTYPFSPQLINVSHQYDAPGNYLVSIYANAMFTGYYDSSFANLSVSSWPIVDMAWLSDTLCSGTMVALACYFTGGVGPFNTLWTSSSGLNAPNTCFIVVTVPATTTYTFSVTDANGCVSSDSFTLTVDSQPLSAFSYNQTSYCAPPEVCFTDQSQASCSPIISWLWDFGDGFTSVSQNPCHNFCCPGAYQTCLIVTDTSGYSDTSCQTIFVTSLAPIITYSVTNVSCYGGNDGSACINLNGGTPPFSFLWSNGATISCLSSLTSGQYCVTVTDYNGCWDSTCLIITEPSQLIAAFNASPLSTTCPPLNVQFQNQSPGATSYLWDFGDGSPYSTSANPSHIYNVIDSFDVCLTVTDTNGCSDMFCDMDLIVITGPMGAFDFSPTESCGPDSVDFWTVGTNTDLVIFDFGDGVVTPAVSPNDTIAHFYWPAYGTFYPTAYMIDTIGNCTTSVALDSVLVKGISLATGNVSCFGLSDGWVGLDGFLGEPPFQYLWSTGDTTANTQNNLPAGNYSLTVTDAVGCVMVDSVTVSEPPQLVVTAIVNNNVSCYGGLDGSACATVSGGTPPYNINWSNGIPQYCFNGFSAGIYVFLIEDANGCTAVSNPIFITEPPQLFAHAGLDTVSCNSDLVDLHGCSPIGGTPPYNYSWLPTIGLDNPNSCNPYCSPNQSTTYTQHVTDANGCLSLDSVFVLLDEFDVDLGTDTIICLGDTVLLHIDTLNPIGSVWYNLSPQTWSNNVSFLDWQLFPQTDFTYSIWITDSLGCGGYLDSLTILLDTTCVYPGDANYDNIADNDDVLNIGIAYNTTGPTRPNATLNWDGQACFDWSQNFANGANYKHADCDGNGTVNDDDTLAITLNYGMIHPRLANPDNQMNGSLPPLYFIPPTDSLFAGDTVVIPVMLGEDTTPVNNIYGLAFTLFYDTSIVEAGTAKFHCNPSWMGTQGTNLLCFNYDLGNGALECAEVRTDQTNISGFGEIGSMTVVMQDDISGKDFLERVLHLSTGNIYAINYAEQELDIAETNDSVVVYQEETSVSDFDLALQIKIYPNPTGQWAVISWQLAEKENPSIKVFDHLGQEIFSAKPSTSNLRLQTSNWSPGLYMIQIETESETRVFKLVVAK